MHEFTKNSVTKEPPSRCFLRCRDAGRRCWQKSRLHITRHRCQRHRFPVTGTARCLKPKSDSRESRQTAAQASSSKSILEIREVSALTGCPRCPYSAAAVSWLHEPRFFRNGVSVPSGLADFRAQEVAGNRPPNRKSAQRIQTGQQRVPLTNRVRDRQSGPRDHSTNFAACARSGRFNQQ